MNTDYALGILTSAISVILQFFLSDLRVRLSDLRVEILLNSIQDHFNAEDGEPDAEFAESHAIVK